MENYSEYFLAVLIFSLLVAGWMAVQLLSKKMKTRNHIKKEENGCEQCEKKNICASEDNR